MIISYYTKNNKYDKVFNKYLLPTLKKFNLKYDIEAVENLGNWQNNTYFKVNFIKRKLLEYKDTIIWIDVDATIEQYPKLLYNIPKEYDIAVFYSDWYLHWRNQPGMEKRELISATMVFKYNDKVLKLLDDWIELNRQKIKTGTWEQRNLQDVLDKNKELKIYKLPPEYCAIILHDKKLPKYIKEPYIIQHQASRDLK